MRTPGSGSIADMGPSSGSESDSDDDVVDAGTVNVADELDDAQSDDTESTSSSRSSGYTDELGGDPVESGGSSGGSSSSGSSSPDPADEFGQELGGDPTGTVDNRNRPEETNFSDRQRRAADALDEQTPTTDVGASDVVIADQEAQLTEQAQDSVRAGRRGAVRGLVGDPVEAETVEAPTGSRRFSGIFADPQERPDVTERRNEQREEFRVEAAEELDTTPDNVEVSFNEETNEFRATQQLTDDQQRINRLTGGRFESAVEAGSDAREAAADAFSGPLDTATDAATLPGRIFGGATVSGVEATTDIDVSEVEAPDVSAEQALGLGAAGVVTPEPATSIGGGALAAGAALTLGAAELRRRRRSEIEAPQNSEFVQSELDVGAGDVEASEIDPGEIAPASSEIDVGSGAVEAVEVEVPEQPADSAREVGIPDVEAAGVLQQGQLEELEEEEDFRGTSDFVIDDSVIEDTGPTVEIPEDEQMRQIREELERRQEFVRDDIDDFAQVDRQPVRFPAQEANEPTVESGVEADGFEATQPSVGTATSTATRSGTRPFGSPATDTAADVAVGQFSEQTAAVEAPGFEAVTPATDVFTDTAVEAQTVEAVETTTVPEQTAVEFAEAGGGNDRRRPRFGLTDGEIDDLDDIGTAVDDAQFTYELDLPDFLR